ncbi:MAG: AAA family ATPase [Yoonia sp.]
MMDDAFDGLPPFVPPEDYQDQAPSQPAAKFEFVAVADLKYRNPDYIIDELIETETLGLMFGDPGCGKSFLAVDIALSVASGNPFHGRSVKQGSVFFIAGEGHNGLARRFAAWSKARGVSLAGVPLFKSERAAQFLDGSSAKAVADAVASLAESHGVPTLIIIDTLARNFGAGDENNTRDMSEFVVAVDDLKARFPGCAVLIVHHSGHAEKQRARGAMALKGALDLEYRVEKDGGSMKLVNTKMKDAEPPHDMFFDFRQVELDGIAKSAVLEAGEAPERTKRLTTSQRLAQDSYATAAVSDGVWDDGAFLGVHVDDWRQAFYSKHTGDSTEAKKKAFQRVRSDMVSGELMTVQDDVYLTSDAGLQMSIMMQRDKRDIAGQIEKCPDAEAGYSGTSGTNA